MIEATTDTRTQYGNENGLATGSTAPSEDALYCVRVASPEEFRRTAGDRDAIRRAQEEWFRGLPATWESFAVPGFCFPCGIRTDFAVDRYASYLSEGVRRPNWREQLVCPACKLSNRLRAALHLLDRWYRPSCSTRIYLSEQTTPLFAYLAGRFSAVIGSEHLGGAVPRGTADARGIRNEDLTALTFSDASLELVLSFDVLEHVPKFSEALHECARVLKPGGGLLVSVPFDAAATQTAVCAVQETDGTVRHIRPPQYHGDPLCPESGCLVYQIFGWDLLSWLTEAGFSDVAAYMLWSREFGYLGEPQMLFTARRKPQIVGWSSSSPGDAEQESEERAEVLYHEAIMRMSEGDLEGSVILLESASAATGSGPAFANLAVAYARAHRWSDADAAFQRALGLTPQDPVLLEDAAAFYRGWQPPRPTTPGSKTRGQPRSRSQFPGCGGQQMRYHYCRGRGMEIGPGGAGIPDLNTIKLDICNDFNGRVYPLDYLHPADDLPFFRDGELDFIIHSNVFEHFANPLKALWEWRRVIRPGGSLYLIVPDRRLWVPDRECQGTTWADVFGAAIKGAANYPPDWRARPASEFNVHHTYWSLWTLVDVIERLSGFVAVDGMESPFPVVERIRSEVTDAAPSAFQNNWEKMTLIQRRAGVPELGHNFELVLRVEN